MKQPSSLLAELDDWSILSSFLPEGWAAESTRVRGVDACPRNRWTGCSLANTVNPHRQRVFASGDFATSRTHLPKKDPESCRAWLHGKLFTSLLVERMIGAAKKFSPWGYELDAAPEHVAGNGVHVS